VVVAESPTTHVVSAAPSCGANPDGHMPGDHTGTAIAVSSGDLGEHADESGRSNSYL
jgi:hypothetical protein